jgi:hypothetical protein
LWQYLRKEPAFPVKAYAVLVNTINFTESSHSHAQTAVMLNFLTTYAQLAAITRASRLWKSRLRQMPTPLRPN